MRLIGSFHCGGIHFQITCLLAGVVGRIMVLEYVYVLVSGTCEIVITWQTRIKASMKLSLLIS
jgi:hypothetical protein